MKHLKFDLSLIRNLFYKTNIVYFIKEIHNEISRRFLINLKN